MDIGSTPVISKGAAEGCPVAELGGLLSHYRIPGIWAASSLGPV